MDNSITLDDSGVFNDDGTSGGDADGVNMVFSGNGLFKMKQISLTFPPNEVFRRYTVNVMLELIYRRKMCGVAECACAPALRRRTPPKAAV